MRQEILCLFQAMIFERMHFVGFTELIEVRLGVSRLHKTVCAQEIILHQCVSARAMISENGANGTERSAVRLRVLAVSAS